MRFFPAVVFIFATLSGAVCRAGEDSSAVLREVNLARTSPRAYAQILLAQQNDFRSVEERRALQEAVHFLEHTRPLPPLTSSSGLAMSAMSHVQNQGGTGAVGHRGTDSSSPWDRIGRYGQWLGCVGENIAYGYHDARRIVSNLIVDAGVGGRGHRKNLFNPDFRVVGVACGTHARYGSMCVMDFAGSYDEGSGAVSRTRTMNAGWSGPGSRIAL